jgi:hypothetical protein
VANHVQIELGGTCLEEVLGEHPVEFPSQDGRNEHQNVHEIFCGQAIDELEAFEFAKHVRLDDCDEQINCVTCDKRAKHRLDRVFRIDEYIKSAVESLPCNHQSKAFEDLGEQEVD